MKTWMTMLPICYMVIFVTISIISSDANSVVPRNTDKLSEVREKLQRLHELLMQMDTDDESDLLKVVDSHKGETNKGEAHHNKGTKPTTSEDMNVSEPPVQDKKDRQSETETSQKAKLPSGTDDSIQILARALAKLKQPPPYKEESPRDLLTTRKGDDDENNKRTVALENMISRALERLSEGDRTSFYKRKQQEYARGNGQEEEDEVDDQTEYDLEQEAVRVVETRLMQDIALANKLGISVEDLIQDLERKVYKQAKYRQMERQMDLLSRSYE